MQDYYIREFLELPEFFIKNYFFKDKKHVFRIEKKTTYELCPICNNSTNKIHSKREQKIKDIPIRDRPVILILSKRRFKCLVCFKVFTEQISSVQRYCRHTERFLKHIYTKGVYPLKWVAKENFISEPVAARIFYRQADIEIGKRRHDPITIMGIDENSFKKGSIYNTVITDIGKRNVIEIIEGKSRKGLDEFFSNYPYCELIRYVALDMCPLFFKSVKKHCPKAYVVIDKFHVISYVTRMLGKTRRKRTKISLNMRITRKMLMKPYEKLSEKEKHAIDYLKKDNINFSHAYDFKERLKEFYKLNDYEAASKEILEIIGIAMQSGYQDLIKFGRMLMKWEQYILNYFIYNVTNGYTEGVNNRIKLIKRMSYGFRNFLNFRSKILLNFSN